MSVFHLGQCLMEQHLLWGRLGLGDETLEKTRLVLSLLEFLEIDVLIGTTFHLICTKEAVNSGTVAPGEGLLTQPARSGRLPGGIGKSYLGNEGGKSIPERGAECERVQRLRRRHGVAICQDFHVVRGENVGVTRWGIDRTTCKRSGQCA